MNQRLQLWFSAPAMSCSYIGEKPTGSGDPFQLRRAALGIIRIALENDLRLALATIIGRHYVGQYLERTFEVREGPYEVANREDLVADLLAFLAERLKVHLREKGARHDLIDAVFALPGQDDLALVVKRVEALSEFLATDDGANLLIGAKRAANILAIEEKKDNASYAAEPDGALLVASRGGSPRNPVWYYNIAKNPDITIRHRGRKLSLRARLATPEEKPALWPICDNHYAPYADYRARTDRDIPIFVCEPY